MTPIAIPPVAANPGAIEIDAPVPKEKSTGDAPAENFADVLNSKQSEIGKPPGGKESQPATVAVAEINSNANPTASRTAPLPVAPIVAQAAIGASNPARVAPPVKKAPQKTAIESKAVVVQTAPSADQIVAAAVALASQPKPQTVSVPPQKISAAETAPAIPAGKAIALGATGLAAGKAIISKAIKQTTSSVVGALATGGPKPATPVPATTSTTRPPSNPTPESSTAQGAVTPRPASQDAARAPGLSADALAKQTALPSIRSGEPQVYGTASPAATQEVVAAQLQTPQAAQTQAPQAVSVTEAAPAESPSLGPDAAAQVISTTPSGASQSMAAVQAQAEQTISSTAGMRATGQISLSWAPQTARGSARIAGQNQGSSEKVSGSGTSKGSNLLEAAASEALTPIGTAIATHNRAMAIKAHNQEPVTSFRVSDPEVAHNEQPTQTSASLATKSPTLHPQGEAQQATEATVTAQNSTVPVATPISGQATATSAAAVTPAQIATTATLNRVMEAADKMRTIGDNRVELQVKLDDGQQVTVRLQMTQGTVHTIFKTESPELRQAIEQNWGGFRTDASQRGLQISTPVFESPSSQGGFNSFANREQTRQQTGEGPERDGANIIPMPNPALNGKATPALPVAASLVGTGVQLYA
jgi:hypothetical protein